MASPKDDKFRFERTRDLFDQAWSMPPEKREAFVRGKAGRDEELAREVLRLLEGSRDSDTGELVANGGAPAKTASPAAGSSRGSGGAASEDLIGQRLGPYRILSTLGEGGMGVVYLAEQREPMRRRVALKVLKRGMDSKAFLARFEAERQALAIMEHSCIARVYDAGLAETGQPFLTMEYVKGVPVTDYCDQNKLSLAQRLDLFVAICSAVQHAHTKGVMHRDLKPSNILVSEQDGRPEPKIIDFGLAKAVDHRLVEQTVFTETGQIIGTPEYMSPEQAGVGGLDIDTRTDVFSLGVLLYQLLTGTLPVTREELLKHGYYEMQRVIKEEEMQKPSTKVTTLGDGATAYAKARRLPLGELQRKLRGELDWIVMKAIEKDRNRRYTTAAELAADLLRHLNDEPVSAGPPSAGYLLSKLARRYRGALFGTAAVVVALCFGLGVALWQWRTAEGQRVRAEQNEQTANAERDRSDELSGRYRRLEDKAKLRRFREQVDGLWPEHPRNQERLSGWLAAVDAWLQQMPDYRDALDELRRGGRQVEDAWLFADGAEQSLHDALAELVDDLKTFRGPEGALRQVQDSSEWCRQVVAKTVGEFEAAWRDVNDRLRVDSRFEATLKAQPGLVPLGRDRDSDLEEFWFARFGDRPVRTSDGRMIEPGVGIIFVLIPGGEALIGSNRHPMAYPTASPQRRVALEPFFLAKYELTQAQWLAISGQNPSAYQSAGSGLHPVESVSWFEVTRRLRRHGLELPTEAQWEYACRAGTSTHWWFGDEKSDLQAENGDGRFNAASHNIPDAKLWPEYRDPYPVHCWVGRFAANGFGLHDMHGNIAEFTRGSVDVVKGSLVNYANATFGPGDGVLLGPATDWTVIRGGSFFKRVEDARSARRIEIDKAAKYPNVGLRVARHIER